MKRSSALKVAGEYFQIGLGIFAASIGLKAFLLPNGFLDGGATGIALLISRELEWDISILLIVVSIPFLIIGLFTVSRRILLKSVISIVLLSISISVESFPILTEDKLLIAIFGGLFLGAGIGLAVRNGAVLDGSELLGIFFFERFGFRISTTILVFNIILFGITAAVVSLEIALYSILTYIVTAKVIDLVIDGFEDFIGFTIISEKSELLERVLRNDTGVGFTVYRGYGGYGKKGLAEEKRIIHTVINRIDMRRTYRTIEAVDPEAFVIEFEINAVKGGYLRRYLHKSR